MEQGSKLMPLQSEMSSQKLLLTSKSESLLERKAKLADLSKEAHQRVEELEEHKAAEIREDAQLGQEDV